MIRSLRKGSTAIELNHKWGTDSINAENTEVELRGPTAIFRTYLKPVNSNQRDDADRFLEDPEYGLETVSIIDKQIRKKLGEFLRSQSEIKQINVELVYGASKIFEAELVPLDGDGVLFNL